jgi:hypothetical protein
VKSQVPAVNTAFDKPKPAKSRVRVFNWRTFRPPAPARNNNLPTRFEIWNRIVRTRYPEWVNRPAFIVAEMNLITVPANPVTLEFVDQIKIKIILEHRID